MTNLTGRVILVTGAGGGLGRDHALLLARHGARIAVNDLSAEAAQSVADEIAAAGGEETAIIGGAHVFMLFEPQAERIELTQIHADYDGDTFMDAPDPERWTEVAREDHQASGDTPAFSFITYERRT